MADGLYPDSGGGEALVLVAVALQVLQTATVVLAAPLYSGVISRAEAMVQSKHGPSVWQPYRDLAKLLRKATVTSADASLVFRAAPFVAFSCYLTVSVIVPVITSEPLPLAFLGDLLGGAFVLALASFAISLAGLDTASHLGGLGSSRTAWIGSLAEPALILVFFTVGVLSASDNPYLTNHAIAHSPYILVLPTHVLGAVAFFMLVLAENGRIPIDNPSGVIEISMIEEGRTLEFSGRGFAILKWGSWMKLFLMSSIFMNVFVLPWGLGSAHTVLGGVIGIAALGGKLAVCGLAIVIIDTSFAKLRFFRIAEYLTAAFLFGLLGVMTSYVVAR
ncbi:MAG: respiratory chain complex I subunit 1 family protein [Acidimicrobiales bacterium]